MKPAANLRILWSLCVLVLKYKRKRYFYFSLDIRRYRALACAPIMERVVNFPSHLSHPLLLPKDVHPA
jgi:hypothetical protein